MAHQDVTSPQICEMIHVYPDMDGYGCESPCKKPAVAKTVDKVHVCLDCAYGMDKEGFMPKGWKKVCPN